MRLTKVLGLAAVAAMAAMAFIGTGAASAQHQIALCKSLATLCQGGELWPGATKILALAKNPKLETKIGNIVCEDSKVTAELATNLGSPLILKSPTVTFGKLPTPTLGIGCTGVCVEGNPESIHVQLEKLEVIVEPVNKYSLRGTGLTLILNCPFLGTCVYRGENVVAPISHDGTHPEHANVNLALAEFKEPLNRQVSHGGNPFCPETATWTANYVLTLAHNGEKPDLAWPSLDK